METNNDDRIKLMAARAVVFVFVLFSSAELLATFMHLQFQDPLLLGGATLTALKILLTPARPRTCVIVVEAAHLEELRAAVGNNPDVHFPQSATEALKVITKTVPEKSGTALISKMRWGDP